MSQLHRFLQAVKATFSNMSATQRQEVATYLVPEVIYPNQLYMGYLKLIDYRLK